MAIFNFEYIAEATKAKYPNVIKLNVAGKERHIYFQDKFKKYEESIKKKIYDFILKDEDNHDGNIDKDSKSNAGYLDYFEVVEHGDGYTINATMINYQYMITCLKNGKPTSESKVIYLD